MQAGLFFSKIDEFKAYAKIYALMKFKQIEINIFIFINMYAY
jgi:hypothetical protein